MLNSSCLRRVQHQYAFPSPSTTKLALTICFALILAACSSPPHKSSKATTSSSFISSGGTKVQNAALTRHYKRWYSAPYKLGGLSKSGIDCSGFVHITYRDVFRKKLPRSTELLAKKGQPVSKKSLKFGDLVFFKTGRKLRHVGIYVNDGKFIHASSSRGVMQSSLKSNYWSQHYWKAKRIL